MPKHRWTDPIRPDLNSTLRTCSKCGLVRITRHEPDNTPRHWTEFEVDGRRVPAVKTPICEAA